VTVYICKYQAISNEN